MTKGKDKVTDADDPGRTTTRTSALRSARAAGPPRRADEDRGQGQRGQGGARRAASWKDVAKKYSIDEASKAQGGKLPGVAKGQQEKAFDDAVFAAKKGKLEGPVKTQFGWNVFEVDEGHAGVAAVARRRPRTTIKQLLQLAEPAEGARRVRQGLPRGVQGQDELPRRLPRRGVQERSEAEKTQTRLRHRRGSGPASDAQAHADHRAARRSSGTEAGDLAAPRPSLRLDEITRRLRRECPWDREQDERSIVPHTVEEAYELADAAHSGDDAKLVDELGDVLFQVYFLVAAAGGAGRGSLAEVADHCREKLIRRHPHVFGEVEADTAGDVVRNWDADQAGRRERAGRSSARCPRPCRAALRAEGPAARRAARSPRGREATGSSGRERRGFADADASGRSGAASGCSARSCREARRRAAGRPRARPAARGATAIQGQGGRSERRSRRVHARQILDSRGNPTVEVEV